MSKTQTQVKRQTVPAKDLSLKAIHDGIPQHLFRQDTLRSTGYLLRDLLQVAATYTVMVGAVEPLLLAPIQASLPSVLSSAITFAVWNVFWFVQGLNFTGLWVLAHECGHQAFSPSKTINDSIGFVLHSALLVPYHSWRISHGTHHKHTNHTEKDTVFVPEKRTKSDETLSMKEVVSESPIVSLFFILVMWTVGWPGYLLANLAGQKYSKRTNHFEPSSPIFRPNDREDVLLSDFGILATLFFLAFSTYNFGWLNVFCYYTVPYLWTNMWLVTITYLQHSDTRVPHYNEAEWNFVRGALATIDRDYGFINHWLHHITDSHVVHHLFSTMPHYNAIEVTRKYLPGLLPAGVHIKDEGVFSPLYNSWRACRYIVPSEGVTFFRQ